MVTWHSEDDPANTFSLVNERTGLLGGLLVFDTIEHAKAVGPNESIFAVEQQIPVPPDQKEP